MASPDRALVQCVDEKSQIQPQDRTQPGLSLTFGKPSIRTHDNSAMPPLWPRAKSSGSSSIRHRSVEFL